MKPWNYEAGTINYSLLTNDELYFNATIDSYLEYGDHDHKFVLIGPKGIGKTLFIQYKSHLYRKNLKEKGFVVYPANSFCENLMIPNELLSKEDLLKFSTFDFWEKIWVFTLCVIICKTKQISIPKEINEIIDNSNSCSSIITIILQNRNTLSQYFKSIPKLLTKIEEITSGVGLFLDDIDQAFRKFLEDYHYSDYINEGISPSIKVWTNAQNGLLSAIYSLNRHNSHLKVFATIRSEAFNAQSGEMKLNFKNYCTELKYSKEEIRKIYDLNIRLMDEKYYINKSSTDLNENFVGFSKMPHPFARNNNKTKKRESTFDFIFRHTLGRPREIVYLGNQIFEDLVCSTDFRTSLKKDKIEDLRWLVNKIGSEVVEQYFKEIIPRFEKSELVNFLNIVQCNVIPSILLNDRLEKKMKHFYSIGILGYVKKKNHLSKANQYKQVFLPVSQYSYNEDLLLPKSKYYITHPTLDDQLKKLFDLSFYNNSNIIGNNYDFVDSEFITRKFEVALSFAGENREFVEQVATQLKTENISVFYDNHHKTSLWGKDLYQHLNIIYKNLAKTCVIFISEHYPLKKWTKHELKAAQSREFSEEYEYILPVRFDDTIIPGLNETQGFLDARQITAIDVAEAIIEKTKTLPNTVYKK